LNRLDEVIIFDILNIEAIRQIVSIQISELIKRFHDKGIKFNVSDKVTEFLAKEGFDPHYGARPLKRLIQTKLLNALAQLIISKGLGDGDTVSVDFKNNECVFSIKTGKKKVEKVYREKDIVEQKMTLAK